MIACSTNRSHRWRLRSGRVALGAVAIAALALPRGARAETDSFGLGTGRDGSPTIATANTIINSYASLTLDAAVNTTTLSVDDATGFAKGQVVLLWQTTGMATATSGDQTTVNLATQKVGHYELGRLADVVGTVLTLTNPIANANGYKANTAQVIRVPEYQNPVISGSVAAQPWDGKKGGVVAMLATGTVTNNGVISADASGFRGGQLVNNGTVLGCTLLDGVPANGYAEKGEGLVPSLYGATHGGRGNITSGGGGGDCHNSGGGGGGHIGVGSVGGNTWVGDTGGSRAVGGLGGAALTYDPLAIFTFGGGGGTGDENNSVGSNGGIGGGVVFVRAGGLAGTGTVSANGQSAAGGLNDGQGGGGAGGGIVILLTGSATCTGTALTANGGNGGNQANAQQHGPGGGGAGGLVYLRSAAGSVCAAQAGYGAPGAWSGGGSAGAGPTTMADQTASTGKTDTATTPYAGMTCSTTDLGADKCGGCLANTDCPTLLPVCNLVTHACLACNGNAGSGALEACPVSAPSCVATGPNAGSCVQCQSDGECAGNIAGTLCDTTKNTCGTCTAGNPLACPAASPLCDTSGAHDVCAACNGSHGSGATLACATAALPFCVTSGPNAGSCVECASDGDCAANPNGGVCDATKATCGACNAGEIGTCAGTTPLCDTSVTHAVCVACNGNFASAATHACSTAGLSACVTSGGLLGSCVQCTSLATCSGTTPLCDLGTDTCVGCNGNFGSAASHSCPVLSRYCNIATGACSTNCQMDSDCGAGQWCDNVTTAGTCTTLVPNGTPVPGGSCVAITAARACVSGLCSVTDGQCGLPAGEGTCTANAQCRAGVCVASGGNAGKCLSCNTDNDCSGVTPACNATSNLCVTCTVAKPDRCTGTTPLCNGPSSTCIGCGGDNGSVSALACPLAASPLCAADGSCTKCTVNTDCTTGTHAGPFCNAQSGACGTGCSVDGDCGAGQWCDDPTSGAGKGVCAPKVPNGQPIPQAAPLNGQCSNANATRVCVNGVCEANDNQCGLANGSGCASMAECRSAVCAGDGKCGSPNGDACMNDSTCRGGACGTDAKCGKLDGVACTTATECRSAGCSGGLCGGLKDAGVVADAANDGPASTADALESDALAMNDDGGGGVASDARAGDAAGGVRDAGADARAAGDANSTGTGGAGGGTGGTGPVSFGGGGCTCHVGGHEGLGVGGGFALVALAGLLTRRRRRRR